MKTKLTYLGVLMLLVTFITYAQTPKNVIIYIGDGFGIAPKTAARMAMGQGKPGKRFTSDPDFLVLALDKLKYNATVTTHSLNSWITDSAPGAAVYAAGKKGKVDNEILSMDPATATPIETILENAKKQGYAVGLVTTTRVTHATPAAFASHIWFRDLEDYISAQYIASSEAEYEAIFNSSPTASYKYLATRDWELPTPKIGVELDVILGGGSRHFLPKNTASSNSAVKDKNGAPIMDNGGFAVDMGKGKRADDVDLVEYAKTQKNYTYVNSRDALLNIDLSQFTSTNNKKLLGLFHTSMMDYEQDRQTIAPWEPSLSDMTNIALKVLKAKGGSKGFFLLVEGGRIDHLAHANEGGISVITGSANNEYTVDSDKAVYVTNGANVGGDANYGATPATARQTNVYGSDYMIKEVIAFDYAVAEGRSFLGTSSNGNTLMFSTSDHECGGFAAVALHDEGDQQANGTKIRTYAAQISKSNASEKGYATPTGIVRGDGGDNGWYPDYTMVTFQDKKYPQPSSPTAKRIVIAYGSNPLTNGNGVKAGGTPGNHTPQDIWVGAEDNTGTHAMQIAGRGLLDNTAITPIMADFLGLTDFVTGLGNPAYRIAAPDANVYPTPFDSHVNISFDLAANSNVSVEVINNMGIVVKKPENGKFYESGSHVITFDGSMLDSGMYIVVVKVNNNIISKKMVKI